MADKDLEEENKRLKGTIKGMMDGRHERMMRAKKNRGNITLDLSTDIPLPKSLGGNADEPIKEHRSIWTRLPANGRRRPPMPISRRWIRTRR